MKQQSRNRKARQERQRVSNTDGVSRGYNDQHLEGSRRGKESRREGIKKETEFCMSWRRKEKIIQQQKCHYQDHSAEGGFWHRNKVAA